LGSGTESQVIPGSRVFAVPTRIEAEIDSIDFADFLDDQVYQITTSPPQADVNVESKYIFILLFIFKSKLDFFSVLRFSAYSLKLSRNKIVSETFSYYLLTFLIIDL
jgi:hypothetical protein